MGAPHAAELGAAHRSPAILEKSPAAFGCGLNRSSSSRCKRPRDGLDYRIDGVGDALLHCL